MPEDVTLEVDALTVRFGGVTAVDGVCLTAGTGAITGLIGPNGAGKTTTFNACSGLIRPSSGEVRIGGERVTHLSPQARAQRGLGRTFQRMELFDSLSVERNVALGREARLAGASPRRHLVARGRDRAVVAAAAARAIELCGIGHLARRDVASLSTGQRRLVELARVVAGDFRVLLLDEPSSGLDHDETAHLGTILRTLVDEEGVGILLVEHDMALVMATCRHLFVVDFGRVVFAGTPREVCDSPVVRRAYLGAEGAA